LVPLPKAEISSHARRWSSRDFKWRGESNSKPAR